MAQFTPSEQLKASLPLQLGFQQRAEQAVLSTDFSAAALSNPVRVVNVPDNTLASTLFDPVRVVGTIIHPFKTVVVGQDPPAGQEVPAGTTINLTLAPIDNIPLSTLTDAGGLTFQSLGAVSTAIANAPAVATAIANASSFNQLSAGDQTAFKTFLSSNNQANADPVRAFSVAKLAGSF